MSWLSVYCGPSRIPPIPRTGSSTLCATAPASSAAWRVSVVPSSCASTWTPLPRQILDSQQRSLCLIKPDSIKGCFRLDAYSGKYQARMAFKVGGRTYRVSHAKGGLPVTDLKWRALGRAWLPEEGGWTDFDARDLEARYGIQEVYLAVGLTRSFEGKCWPIVIGVHTVPDYEAEVDYDNM